MPISEVYNMDCMEYMKDIPDKFFDLAIVDPPYGINAPNMRKYRPKDDRCTNKQIAKRRKRNKNRKTHRK